MNWAIGFEMIPQVSIHATRVTRARLAAQDYPAFGVAVPGSSEPNLSRSRKVLYILPEPVSKDHWPTLDHNTFLLRYGVIQLYLSTLSGSREVYHTRPSGCVPRGVENHCDP